VAGQGVGGVGKIGLLRSFEIGLLRSFENVFVMRKMRIVANILGGIAVVAFSFFATLYAIDYYDSRRSPDEIRTRNAKAVMAALEKYRAAKGSYPVIPDRPISELAGPLADFIAAIPPDPPGKPTQYASFDGKIYALLMNFDRDGRCIVEPKKIKTGFWGVTPCGFSQ
jgi:hypothetical protein